MIRCGGGGGIVVVVVVGAGVWDHLGLCPVLPSPQRTCF